MSSLAFNIKRFASNSKCSWTWNYIQRIKHLQPIPPMILNASCVRSYSIEIRPGMIEQCLSDQNKQRIIKHLKTLQGNKWTGLREAAVLVPFCLVDNKPSLLFTLRSSSLVGHRGQVSFPGGRKDKEDKSLVETAIRETTEEMGIERNKIEVWGPMIPLPDRKRTTSVTAVLAYLRDIDVDNIQFNPDEVSEVFHLTLEHILQNRKYTIFKKGSTMPVFVNGPHNVWGLTACIMDLLFEIVFPGQYKRIMNIRGK